MIRKAFKMEIFPDKIEEYIERHNPIWDDLKEVLKNNGVHNYSIYLDKESNFLFAYVELESEEKWDNIAETAICKKWWKSMIHLMKTNGDDSPVSKNLPEIFHLEQGKIDEIPSPGLKL